LRVKTGKKGLKMGMLIPEVTQPVEQSAKTYPEIGIRIPQIYLPCPEVDMPRWAVVACDQYTSQPEYWDQVEKFVGDAPSTLRLVLPEVYLGAPDESERVRRVQASMSDYLEQGILEAHSGMMYVERSVAGKTRRGLLLAVDLECYDYHPGSQSLIRATEGTIIDRLPPRMKIRQGAALELPHILVLIDDPQGTVIEPLANAKSGMVACYDFDLMMDSGHVCGYRIEDPDLEAQVIRALHALAEPQQFARKYGLPDGHSGLLFAMGDGNHSLATAKAVWDQIKAQTGMDHPARYALVEIENVHDQGLEFEPIHRVLFNLKGDILEAIHTFYGETASYTSCQDCLAMVDQVENQPAGAQAFGIVINHKFGVVKIGNPASNLAAGSLQPLLDSLVAAGQADKIDYVHGKCVICRLSARPNTVGFYLPPLAKSDLFKTVILDGALPRKTFSLGEAHEKRFYIESRRIDL
jgi:Protein of unknown function (DUF1015)